MQNSSSLANRSFQSFGEESIGIIKLLKFNYVYLSGSGIWLDKLLANDAHFAKFAPKFSPPSFCTIKYPENEIVT